MLLARPAELKITSLVLVFIDLHHIHRQTLHLTTQQLNECCSHLYRLLPFNVVLTCIKFSIASMTLAKSQYSSLVNPRHICSTSNVLTNRRNIHHRPTLLWRFLCSWRRIQNCQLTYLLNRA